MHNTLNALLHIRRVARVESWVKQSGLGCEEVCLTVELAAVKL